MMQTMPTTLTQAVEARRPYVQLREIGRAAGYGALMAFVLAIVYGAVFAVGAAGRASLQIAARLNGAEGTVATSVMSGFSILIASLAVSALLGLVAAIIAAVAMALARGLTLWIAPGGEPQRAAMIGMFVGFSVLIGMSLLVRQLSGVYFAQLWPAGYLFWIGLPCVIFLVAAAWLNRRLVETTK
jgi:hypothetical protein